MRASDMGTKSMVSVSQDNNQELQRENRFTGASLLILYFILFYFISFHLISYYFSCNKLNVPVPPRVGRPNTKLAEGDLTSS